MKIVWMILLLGNVLFAKHLFEDGEKAYLKSIDLIYDKDNNLTKFINSYQDACENKNISYACAVLQEFYKRNNNNDEEENYRVKTYKVDSKRCTEGNFKSCINIDRMESAETIVKSKCNDTSTESCKDVIWLAEYRNEALEGQYTDEAANLYSHACKYGDKIACAHVNNAGFQFAQENNTTKNQNKALNYYKIACDSKNGEDGGEYACRNAALTYDQFKDYKNSHSYYIKSCSKKNSESCYDVGVDFYKGYGTEKNTHQAYTYLKDACSLKIRKSCEYLAEIDKIKAEEEKQRKIIEEAKKQEEFKIKQFRQKKFQEGDQTNCGPIIEAKTKMLKIYFPVQGYGNEHWIMRDTIYPVGYGCRFYNGRYIGN